jgi:hypothetical protein
MAGGRTTPSSPSSRKYASLLLLLVAACFFSIARLLFYTLHVPWEEGAGTAVVITTEDDAMFARMARRAVHPVTYNLSRVDVTEKARARGTGGGGRGRLT